MSRAGARVLVVPPADPGSLGDEAIVAAVFHELQARGVRRAGLIGPAGDRWAPIASAAAPGIAVRPHGSLTSPWLRFVLRHYSHFVILGTDILDGSYAESEGLDRFNAARAADALGLTTALVGISISETPRPACAARLGDLPSRIIKCVRDGVSLARVPPPAILTADPAFLLPPRASPVGEPIRSVIASHRAAGRLVVAANFNPLSFWARGIPGARDMARPCADFLQHAMRERPNLGWLLVPHDTRAWQGGPTDRQLHAAIVELLPPLMKAHARAVDEPIGPAEVKGLCGDVDFVLSGRMHLVIAALGMGTPAMAMEYHGKFRGLLDHFGLEDLSLDVDALSPPAACVTQFLRRLDERPRLRSQIESRLDAVLALARKNFDVLGLSSPA